MLVGYDSSDDACVYKISDDVAVIQTVDFFTPIVDDPYLFGQIAAANSLSDVYAMGGVPKLAMNLLCVPTCLPLEVIRQILEGGHSKAVEAGCIIAGGHTIMDDVPKYGLSVMGEVHPDKVLKNVGAQPGDVLVLTKPIGSGIITTGIKLGMATVAQKACVFRHMSTLNAHAAEAISKVHNVHACTDVTGFGLLGHGFEMAEGSGVTIRLDSRAIPLMEGAEELARDEVLTGGGQRNLDYVGDRLLVEEGADKVLLDIAADPQTSGGLLVALPEADARELLGLLRENAPWCSIVGRVEEKGGHTIIFG